MHSDVHGTDGYYVNPLMKNNVSRPQPPQPPQRPQPPQPEQPPRRPAHISLPSQDRILLGKLILIDSLNGCQNRSNASLWDGDGAVSKETPEDCSKKRPSRMNSITSEISAIFGNATCIIHILMTV